MVVSETTCTVLNADFLVVNHAQLDDVSGFPLDAPDGSVVTPSYTFEGEVNSGMCLVNDNVTFSYGGVAGCSASLDGNVALCGGEPLNYGAVTRGESVLFLHNVDTPPLHGEPFEGGGGVLYVNGTSLVYVNSFGYSSVLNSKTTGDVNVSSLVTTQGSVVTFDGLSGKVVKDGGGAAVVSSETLACVPLGTSSTCAFHFGGGDANTGMYAGSSGADVRLVTGGSDGVVGTSDGVVCGPGVVVHAVDGSDAVPAYSFVGARTTGVVKSGPKQVKCVVNGVGGMIVNDTNVCLASSSVPVNYGDVTEGKGVVFLPQSTLVPSGGAPGGGVFLYVDGDHLKMIDGDGVTRVLSLDVETLGGVTSVDSVVRFDGTSGRVVQDTPMLSVDAGGHWYGSAYVFTDDVTTGLVQGGGVGEFSFNVGGSVGMEVSGLGGVTCHLPFRVTQNGSESLPVYAFQTSPSCGWFRDAARSSVRVSSGGLSGASFSSNRNVSFCGPEASTYGGGEGVVFWANCVTPPTTNPPPGGGGFLYAESSRLYFRHTSGDVSCITDFVEGPSGGALDQGVVVFSGTSGNLVSTTVGAFVNNAGGLLVADGGLQFVGGGGGMVLDSGVVTFTGGSGSLGVDGGGVRVVSSGGVRASTGNVATPAYTFSNDVTSGLFASSSIIGLSASGHVSLGVKRVGSVTNVNFCGVQDIDGEGVVFLDEVNTLPVGALASGGGLVYMNGTDFVFHDVTGATHVLSGNTAIVSGPETSTVNALAYWNTETPRTLSASGVTCDNTRLFGSLRYSLSLRAVQLSGNVHFQFGNGGNTTLSIGSGQGVVVDGAPLHVDTSFVRVGGSGGLEESVSGSQFTSNVASPSGAHEWQINGVTCAYTDAVSRYLHLNVGGAWWNGVAQTSTMRVDSTGGGTAYTVSSPSDALVMSVGGTPQVRVTNTGVEVPSGALQSTASGNTFECGNGSLESPSYSFVDDTTSGLFYDVSTSSVGLVFKEKLAAVCSEAPTLCNVSVCSATLPSTYDGGDGILYMGVNVTPPNVNTTGCYFYATSHHAVRLDMDVGNADANCMLNASSQRARITATSVSVDDDTVTNLDSGVSWTSVDVTGMSGGATGALVLSGDGGSDSTVMVEVQVTWDANATGFRKVSITTGVAHTVESTVSATAVNGTTTTQTARLIRRISSGESAVQFAAQVYQNSSLSLNCDVVMTLIRMN